MIKVGEARKRELTTTEKIGLLIAGGGIGAAIALLLAPKRGGDLRHEIADVSRRGWMRGRETAHEISERAEEYYEVTKTRAAEIYNTAETGARQLAEKTREATTAPRGTLAAAIEAGKRAYWEEKRRTEAASILKGRAAYPYELGDGNDQNKQ